MTGCEARPITPLQPARASKRACQCAYGPAPSLREEVGKVG